MAFLVTTIIVEVADDLVKSLPAAQENLEHFTEEAIRNRLFGAGYMPDDVEIDSWAVSSKWAFGYAAIETESHGFKNLVLTSFEAEVLKQVNKDTLEYLAGTGELSEDEDDALSRIVKKIKEL